ncbi:MAG: prepilin-type N-terminal cleavage/methylation domain-containing protein [Gammaproteobacteria bacterium]|nr:prepilin-type N-terminal cleavage/methylation domain-containing protein [Gammaproteobacteria bacterium]
MTRSVSIRGFTLIELVIVIVLTGIVGTLIGQLLSRPIEGFVDLADRAELVDGAELALRRMSRELRLALPNSVRITDGTLNLSACTASGGSSCALEILRTSNGGRYRTKPPIGAPAVCLASAQQDRLSFNSSADCFEVLGNLGVLPVAAGANQLSCMNLPRSSHCLVIANTGQTGANAYNGDNIAGITGATANTVTFDINDGVKVSPSFPLRSPLQRFHIVDTPVSFTCTGGEIDRQADYAITGTQVLSPAGGSSSLLANKLTSCIFKYTPGSSTRNGIVVIDITMRFTASNGSNNDIRLVQQVHVPNIP